MSVVWSATKMVKYIARFLEKGKMMKMMMKNMSQIIPEIWSDIPLSKRHIETTRKEMK